MKNGNAFESLSKKAGEPPLRVFLEGAIRNSAFPSLSLPVLLLGSHTQSLRPAFK